MAELILSAVAAESDITLAELQEKLGGMASLSRSARSGGTSSVGHHAQKKTAHAAEQRRSAVDAAREAWFEDELDLDRTRTGFIDETSANTKMARLYGRAPRGERCRAAVPHGDCRTKLCVRPEKRPLSRGASP